MKKLTIEFDETKLTKAWHFEALMLGVQDQVSKGETSGGISDDDVKVGRFEVTEVTS